MRQSEQVVLRDTSGSRQAKIKEKEDGGGTVTYLQLHGYIVAPPGPITSIHIQKELHGVPPWGQTLNQKATPDSVGSAPRLRTPALMIGLPDFH